MNQNKRQTSMKTIPVSFLIAGMLLPVVCDAQVQDPPNEPLGEPKGGRRAVERPFVEVWERIDQDRDGFISKSEFEGIKRIANLPEEKRVNLFNRLDKDSDGKLSREELGRLGKPQEGQKERPMKRLWELDSDKSGGVSFEEFKNGPLFMKLPAEKQEALFQRLDTDGDHFITPKDRPDPEGKHPDGKSRPKRPDGSGARPEENGEEPPEAMISHFDSNGDGRLSFAEFRLSRGVKSLTEDEQEKRFNQLDRNGDLQISLGDFGPPPPMPPEK